MAFPLYNRSFMSPTPKINIRRIFVATLEQAKIDDVLETLAELEKNGMPHMPFVARLNKILNDMEKQLVANGGHFMVGHKMSIADIGV